MAINEPVRYPQVSRNDQRVSYEDEDARSQQEDNGADDDRRCDRLVADIFTTNKVSLSGLSPT